MNPAPNQIADRRRRFRALHTAGCFVLPNPWDVGRSDLDDTIARLRACAEASAEAGAGAGADCLYAPGLTTREQIAAVVAAVAPEPVNLLIGASSRFTVAEVAARVVRGIEPHAERR